MYRLNMVTWLLSTKFSFQWKLGKGSNRRKKKTEKNIDSSSVLGMKPQSKYIYHQVFLSRHCMQIYIGFEYRVYSDWLIHFSILIGYQLMCIWQLRDINESGKMSHRGTKQKQ